jgi:hypothetical protein
MIESHPPLQVHMQHASTVLARVAMEHGRSTPALNVRQPDLQPYVVRLSKTIKAANKQLFGLNLHIYPYIDLTINADLSYLGPVGTGCFDAADEYPGLYETATKLLDTFFSMIGYVEPLVIHQVRQLAAASDEPCNKVLVWEIDDVPEE